MDLHYCTFDIQIGIDEYSLETLETFLCIYICFMTEVPRDYSINGADILTVHIKRKKIS